MLKIGSIVLLLVCVTHIFVPGTSASNLAYVDGNVSCTIVNLTSESDTKDYSFLTNNTEELIFSQATIDVLDLTKPLATITPWKLLISHSNVSRVFFPAQMSPSVVHLLEMEVDDVHFEENISLQDFRADYTSLQVISPTVAKLYALDILWVTHSQLTNFSFDVLQNSPVSLLYLVSNKIESVTISPGVVCCQSLEEIFLSDNLLTKLDLGTVALMSKLKTLFLENNKLTDLYMHVPSAVPKHTALEDESGDEFCSWREYYIDQEQTDQELST
uniref:Leucine rich immune protein (Coil-less) n=1 Tax=Anopheles maculatus TaxID=74869 RepID=A0A182S9F4_9DIPT